MVLVKKGTKSVQYFLNYELLFELTDWLSCYDAPQRSLKERGPVHRWSLTGTGVPRAPAHSQPNALPEQSSPAVIYFRQRRYIS